MIPVSVFALDAFHLPQPRPGVGLAMRLVEDPPRLREKVAPVEMQLVDSDTGFALAVALTLDGESQPVGVRVTVEMLPGLAAFYLVRIGGRPVALAPAGAGVEAERPEFLTAFVAGTLIDTPDGPRPVEGLSAGDRVTTLANGSRPLAWVAHRRILPVDLLAYPGLRPIALPQMVVGNHAPLELSPRQRVLIDDWRAEVYFGEDRVLVAAEALSDRRDPRPHLAPEGVDYVILLCDRHEVLVANGALTESFLPDEAGLSALTPAERAALAAVAGPAELARRAAYPIVKNAEARALRLPG